MQKRVFIIHGWSGYPKEGWFPWLKNELRARDIRVNVPKMPHADHPKINEWVSQLKKLVGKTDENTFFVGHSIGCQTILRYLEKIHPETRVGGVLFVGGWVNLNPKAMEDGESKSIAKPWLIKNIDWKKVKLHCNKFIAIFSDNDPFVPVQDAQIFKENLNAKTIIVKRKEHFTKKGSLSDVPEVLNLFDTA